jgi:probable F420-dependent oxidoreductase
LRYSIALPYPDRGDEFSDPDVLASMAVAIEAAGIDAVWLTDHPFPRVGTGAARAGHQALDFFSAGGFLAGVTSRLIVHLNLAVMAYRNPFLLARSLSTLDRLSKGRLIAGVGEGYMESEFDALGADYEHRAALLEEGLVAMKAAWRGAPLELEGAGWHARGNEMTPTPYRAAQPTLWRGGNTKQAIRSAVAHCDGWSPFETSGDHARATNTAAIDGPGALAARVAVLRELEEEHGRTTPLQLCFVRPRTEWLEQGDDFVREEIGRFEAVGVDWLAFTVSGGTAAKVVESVERFAQAAGVRRAAEAPVTA